MKNALFDLGGVLLTEKPISILKKINISSDDYNQIITFFKDWDKLDLGEQTLEEKFIECNFSEDTISKYKDILLKYYEIRDINTELIELIKRLKQNGYKVYILSDNNMESYIYYKNLELFSNIDGWTLSCEHNAVKEDGKLFEIIIDKFNLIPEESYFIDDKQLNIDLANKYSMKGYKFDEKEDIENLYNDMRKNGFNI